MTESPLTFVRPREPKPEWLKVRAPWGEDASLRQAVRALREQGETVVCVLPGHEHEADEFDCDRELVREHTGWVVRTL